MNDLKEIFANIPDCYKTKLYRLVGAMMLNPELPFPVNWVYEFQGATKEELDVIECLLMVSYEIIIDHFNKHRKDG